MKKELIELDNTLTQLEIMQKKAKVICEDLEEEYYSRTSKYIEYYKEQAGIKNEIVLDYLCQMKHKLQELRAKMERIKTSF